jgi:hypothetical protein
MLRTAAHRDRGATRDSRLDTIDELAAVTHASLLRARLSRLTDVRPR